MNPRSKLLNFLVPWRVWLSMALFVLPSMVVVIILPGQERRRRMARWSARMVFRLSGVGLRVTGLEHLPETCIVAANHASYLDGIILTAALPPRFSFVIKREITKVPLVGWMLHRLGSEFGERFDKHAARKDASRLIQRSQDGACLGVFPEGTFLAEPGLRPFQLGGFMAAVRAGLPVVPVAIRGARHILPAHVWWPRAGDLEVEVLPALLPEARNGDEARRVRSEVRARILARCGEPDHQTEDN